MEATRFSNSFCLALPCSSRQGILVRIHPTEQIGQPIELDQTCILLGRDTTCQVQVQDDSVSRRHTMIEWDGDCHSVTDLASTNGTFINESRIDKSNLQAGDRLRIGKHIFRYLSPVDIESQYHEIIFQMMTTDGLTQVYNRRFFMEALERELSQSRRSATEVCVLLIDLDRFKSVNDTYGHLAGDAVLVEFARRASAVVRGGELLARYGGEEFAILCSRTSLSEAIVLAERLRQAIAAEPVEFEKHSIPMTVSMGVARTSNQIDSASEILEQADHWLYRAKELGRNQVQYQGKTE